MSVVLSQDDLDFWEENGFVVIHNAVPDENLEAAVNAIWDSESFFSEMNLFEPF